MSEIERARVQAAYDECYKIYSFYSEHRDTILSILRAELEREKNPLTWNERINQMTVEEKADYALTFDMCAAELRKPYGFCDDKYLYKTGMQHNGRFHDCRQCWIDKLNSPYTEGETK